MFIRRTKTRTTEEGADYYSHRLVDSYRVGARVRQRTLLNLGSRFDVPEEDWPELAQRIEAILRGQQRALLASAPEIEREAQRIAAAVLRRNAGTELFFHARKGKDSTQEQAEEMNGDEQESRRDTEDLCTVDLNSFQHMDSRCIGGEAIALSALLRVGLRDKLEALGFNRNQLHAAIGNVIGRMLQPGSELSTHEWLQEHSGLGELLDFDYGRQGLYSLYRASDLLWRHHDEIERYLYEQHCALFDVEETITLFDLTNTFFEGTGQHNAHAAYGHSKEKRSDCPLVTLALVLDGSGFSKRSRIFPGNVSEPSTLREMIEELRIPVEGSNTDAHASANTSAETGARPDRAQGTLDFRNPPTIVMDAGIATEDNVTWLQEQGYPYIVVSRKRHLEFDETRSHIVKERENDTVRAMRVECDNGEIELYCHSELREAKERAIEERFSTRFEQELAHLAEGLDKPRRLKRVEKVCSKIGRLRQKYSRASKHYEITTQTDEAGDKVIALHYRRLERPEDPDAHQGVYCLRSNQVAWNEEQMWRTYIMLTDLEAVFRSLKSELGMRPVYHQKTHRVEGHIFITLLAYNLVHQLRLVLKGQGINDSWEQIRATMSTQMRITTSLRGAQGEQIHVRKSTYPKADQQRLLRSLGLPWTPGKTEKTTITPQIDKQ